MMKKHEEIFMPRFGRNIDMSSLKYLLIDSSAVDIIVSETSFQSIGYDNAIKLVKIIKGKKYEKNIIPEKLYAIKNDNGIMLIGKDFGSKVIVFDYEQSKLLDYVTEYELLIILQKSCRFAIRYWNQQPFTSSEKIYENSAYIFPFPFVTGEAYHLQIKWNPKNGSDSKVENKQRLLVFGYSNNSLNQEVDKKPDCDVFKTSCLEYDRNKRKYKDNIQQTNIPIQTTESSNFINYFKTDRFESNKEFSYYGFEEQLKRLTINQKNIVAWNNINFPIRVEGAAGTGKTTALVLRAIRILKEKEKVQEPFKIKYITHSKQTENVIKSLVECLANPDWLDVNNERSISVETLLDYCRSHVELSDFSLIDIDATESKQNQFELVMKAFKKVNGNVLNTYKPIMTKETVNFFEAEDEINIARLLQFEISVRIKGMAQGDLDSYMQLTTIKTSIPLRNEYDYKYVYRVYTEYQKILESLEVYDTDDIILDAFSRLNGPIWRRKRMQDGVDYLIIDEMHLFNLNEQNIFHFITRSMNDGYVPICFALDYSQSIGEKGKEYNILASMFTNPNGQSETLNTVFRSSKDIAELCACITSSGALLFDGFINPYEQMSTSFTFQEENVCDKPKLIMYVDRDQMMKSISFHIKTIKNKFKCNLSDIGVIFFDLKDYAKVDKNIRQYDIVHVNGKGIGLKKNNDAVICSLPEYVNGLEFKAVILVGVDKKSVPPTSESNISESYLKYTSLNKLYISCSRAKYQVLMLGASIFGVSECLDMAIQNQLIEVMESN